MHKSSLADKNFILTGGKRIGQEVAKWLSERGVNVALTYLNSEAEAKATKDLVEENGGRCFIAKTDATKEEDVKKFIGEASEFFGEIHGLIYMASLFPKGATEEPSADDWKKMLDIHLLGAEFFAKHVRVHLEKNADGGKIVIFSDGAAEGGRPYKGFRHYLVSKAAASALVRALAVDFGPKILVNGIAPGPIIAPPEYSEKEKREIAETTILKKWGGAEEIARAVVYLLEQEFMTGQVLTVDGGRYLMSL